MTTYSKTISGTILSISVSLIGVGLLSACGHPNAMPSGYTHHHEAKGSVDVSADSVTPVVAPIYKSTSDDMVLSLVDIDRAMDDMLRKITARAGVPPKPVFILRPAMPSPFYNAVDSALRTSMRDLGYAISDIETGAYGFAYNARNLSKPRGSENDGHPNVELMLQAYNKVGAGARLLSEQSGNYFIQGAQKQNIKPVEHKFSKTVVIEAIEPASFKQSDIIIEEPEIPVLIEEPIIIKPMVEPIMPDVDFKSLSSGRVSSDYNTVPATRDNVGKNIPMMAGKISKPIEY